MKKGVGSGVGFGARSGSILVLGTDPGIRIRIRIKMSRIPNTVLNYCQKVSVLLVRETIYNCGKENF
jgi:hypothetical protein